MGIEAVLDVARKGKGDSDEEAPESAASPAKSGYRQVLKEAAEDGDWDAFADAVVGLCKQAK